MYINKSPTLFEKIGDDLIRCHVCRHECRLRDGQIGICRVRKNADGNLVSLCYGLPIATAADPIEKKPLFHYLPGTYSYSIATAGCNFRCPWCQNWNISQAEVTDGTRFVEPQEIVRGAIEADCKSIAYTYTEPTVFFEYAIDCAKLAKKEGLGNIFVTNGYMTRNAIDIMASYIDAANVDLKAFNKETYRKLIRANLEGVCDSIKYMHEKGIWLEVTTLIVPGMNDGEDEITNLAKFIAGVDPSIPWHISRFFPQYEYSDAKPTPIETLTKAAKIGKDAGLRYIYIGNAQVADFENTHCHKCDNLLIERKGYAITKIDLGKDNGCPKCKTKLAGVFYKQS